MKGQHLIGGEWVSGAGDTPNINPSDTNDIIGHYPSGGEAEVDAAVAAALTAKHAWARSNVDARANMLRKVSDILMARRDALGELLSREEGKTRAEGVGEIVRSAQIFNFFSGECVRLSGEILPSTRDGVELNITREPMGVVGIISPWNFPMAIPAWKIAPALCYGNTVVFKPAELTPATAMELAKILEEAGVPAGVFNMVFGKGRVVGNAMLSHPGIDAISFTGSVPTGRAVAAACVAATPMKKFQLEMGGKNPMVVLDDADLDLAIDLAASGAFLQVGERCTAPERLIVTEGIHDRFVAGVVDKMKTMKVGNALDPDTIIGAVVSESQLEQNLAYVRKGSLDGAKLAWGGEAVEGRTPGYFMQPALFTEVTNDMVIAREETFAPFASVIRVKDYDEALHVANDTDFGLSSGIVTTSLKYAHHFQRNAQAGMVMVNLPTAGTDYHAPFGGRKSSSYGPREQGRYAAEFFTVVKTAYTKPGY
jgi:aldehyde dehydrogenase (NAD+)